MSLVISVPFQQGGGCVPPTSHIAMPVVSAFPAPTHLLWKMQRKSSWLVYPLISPSALKGTTEGVCALCVWVLCKHCSILYKWLKPLQVFMSSRGPRIHAFMVFRAQQMVSASSGQSHIFNYPLEIKSNVPFEVSLMLLLLSLLIKWQFEPKQMPRCKDNLLTKIFI